MRPDGNRRTSIAIREQHRGIRRRWEPWACLAAVAIGSLLSIGLRWFVPLRPIAFAPGYYDGGLFERAAVALANHNWLGTFDPVTLSKGPTYPLFIAATHRLGIPLQVGTQMLYLLGALSFATCVWLVLHRLLPATLIYLLIAFDPLNYGAESAAVLRDNLYAGLSLLLLSSLFVTTLGALRRTRLIWVLPAAALTGVSGAAFWLCREEGTWILPAALVVVLGLSLDTFIRRPGWIRQPVMGLGSARCGWWGPWSSSGQR